MTKFTKTGSGQTSEKLKKERRVSCTGSDLVRLRRYDAHLHHRTRSFYGTNIGKVEKRGVNEPRLLYAHC